MQTRPEVSNLDTIQTALRSLTPVQPDKLPPQGRTHSCLTHTTCGTVAEHCPEEGLFTLAADREELETARACFCAAITGAIGRLILHCWFPQTTLQPPSLCEQVSFAGADAYSHAVTQHAAADLCMELLRGLPGRLLPPELYAGLQRALSVPRPDAAAYVTGLLLRKLPEQTQRAPSLPFQKSCLTSPDSCAETGWKDSTVHARRAREWAAHGEDIMLSCAGVLHELFSLQAHLVAASAAPEHTLEALAGVTGAALVPPGSPDFSQQDAVSGLAALRTHSTRS